MKVAVPRDDIRTLTLGDARVRIEVVDADPARADALHAWIAETARAVHAAYSRWPLPRSRIRISQIDSTDRSPVPWGQTARRDGEVAVLLYVRGDATPAQLRADWTAAHELAHLAHPYLGRDGRWLAEGLASYYQNVARARAGLMSADAAWRELDAGFARGRRDTVSDYDLVEAGRRRGATMRVYWAGAAFWLEADLALRARGTSIDAVLAEYARCCLPSARGSDVDGFIAALDRAGGDGVFAPLYRRYATSRAFPALDDAYARLGLRRDGGALVFDRDGDAARLRAAITGRR